MLNYKLRANEEGGEKGFSVIELLVVVFVFSILGVIATQILAISLKTSNKSDSISTVKSDVDYALSTMERLLRNSSDITCPTVYPNPDTSNQLSYVGDGVSATFVCDASGGYIYLGPSSLRLTSPNITITNCATLFTCTEGSTDGKVPDSVSVNITAQRANVSGAEGSQYTTQTLIFLRNY